MTHSDKREILLGYLAMGWALVPLHDVSRGHCSCRGGPECKSAGKHPRLGAWQRPENLVRTAEQVDVWPAETNWGLATGMISGVWALDVDPKNGGAQGLQLLLDAGLIAVTRRHYTGSNGMHLLYRMPPDFVPTNRTGALPLGIDVRGEGGQIVLPPSVSGIGSYRWDDAASPPDVWEATLGLLDLIRPPAPRPRQESTRAPLSAQDGDRLHRYAASAAAGVIAELADATSGRNNMLYPGACRLIELCNAPWSGLDEQDVYDRWVDAALAHPLGVSVPRGEPEGAWGRAARHVGTREAEMPPAPTPQPFGDGMLPGMADPGPPPLPSPAESSREKLFVGNPAVAFDWLLATIGTGKLSGMFTRGAAGRVVYTPAIGEHGYRDLGRHARDEDGPAQVQPMNGASLAARVQVAWECFKLTKRDDDESEVPALFPVESARRALEVPDAAPGLRRLTGVVHTPTLRRSGAIVSAPGYDEESGLLHLPDPALVVPPVPERPTPEQIAAARDLVLYMLQDFPFLTPNDRANYLGLLLTPLLRDVAPPSYKAFAINARQPGSGKTLLADIARWIHGGVFRAEMPEDNAELRKQITTILDQTTGPVVVIDNVEGLVKSSVWAGLVTSRDWDDRKLGANELARCVNDRVWTLTGNNMALGGDMVRRTIWVTIDPGRPNPELRTGFAIEDLEAWVGRHRGELIGALLTLARAWFAAGAPAPRQASDSFARWVSVVNGILLVAGIPGTFDAPESREQREGGEDEEWAGLLRALHQAFGDRTWTAREVMSKVALHEPLPGSVVYGAAISIDALPSALADKIVKSGNPTLAARSLGKWLANRRGRWAGGLCVREAGRETRNDSVIYRIEQA